jgi:hypothetical protein
LLNMTLHAIFLSLLCLIWSFCVLHTNPMLKTVTAQVQELKFLSVPTSSKWRTWTPCHQRINIVVV